MALDRFSPRSAVVGLGIALAANIVACEDAPTQLMVVVASDMVVPDEIDRVDLLVEGPLQSQGLTMPMDGERSHFPLSLALVPGGTSLGPVTVTAIARHGGVDRVLQTRRTSFVAGQTRKLTLYLLRACEATTCGNDEVCGVTGCEPIAVAPDALEPWDGLLPELDGGPPVDGGPPDAGPPIDSCVPASEECNGRDDDCDGLSDETFDLQSDVMNCSACGIDCPAVLNGTPRCESGACRAQCLAEHHLCGAACVPNDAVAHCGSSCAPCPSVPNAVSTCDGEQCGFECLPNFGNCDGNAANGCEADLRTLSDCGSCDAACSGSFLACAPVAGRYACVVSCPMGLSDCGGSCIDTGTDAQNCGACGNRCPDVANAVSRCEAGGCTFDCMPGFGDCDGSAANGCETSTSSTVEHCGACGAACDPDNATGICVLGACAVGACTGLFADCDGVASNGCERPTSSLTDCGACNALCERDHAMATCATGACDVAMCEAGWANCDGNPANGCEQSLRTVTSCGACGAVCSPPNAIGKCTTGACQIDSCRSGWKDCDGIASNGCERDERIHCSHTTMLEEMMWTMYQQMSSPEEL